MVDCYLGEIRLFAGPYAPEGWADCNGQLLSLASNQVLFSLIGVTYGGDGRTNFALPNLGGRVAVGAGAGTGLTVRAVGQTGGKAVVSLEVANMPAHTHSFTVSNQDGTSPNALPAPGASGSVVLANMAPVSGGTVATYTDATVAAANQPQVMEDAIEAVGTIQPHENIMPSMGMRYIIALQGLYPQRP
uniref:Microcystin-dependent protein n=1 Tax=Novispirillum itersonii TaxID=189 RepID=A0A7W9ZF30_NOVIT|nr:tail fiber protein [Novispirillum itersonii]MBB6210250.1 microcystin-dependent protein [Novispirillum itersonii]